MKFDGWVLSVLVIVIKIIRRWMLVCTVTIKSHFQCLYAQCSHLLACLLVLQIAELEIKFHLIT